MNKDMIRQIIVLLSLIITVMINGLSNALPLNGLTTGEISDSFNVYFVPAAYVFSIWGVIYLALFAYAIYQLLPSQRGNPRLRRTGWLFVVSSVLNSAWIFCWHYEQFALSVLVMLALLVSLVGIYVRLGVGKTAVTRAEKWLVHLPFSIYLGWITVATIANITILLDYVNWNGWGVAPEIWTGIMLAAGVVIGLLIAITRRDMAYLLVLVWAFAGIGVKQANVSLVATAAWASAIVIAVVIVVLIINFFRREYQAVYAV